jgi:uncharacterized YccA/Bax inhibitor family protein
MRTSNPAFGQSVFSAPSYADVQAEPMTVNGTIHKAMLLTLLVVAPAMVTWKMLFAADSMAIGLATGGLFGGLLFGLVTCFKHEWAPVTAPIYAICEGLLLGAVSAAFEAAYPGLVIQAVSLTFGVLVIMLILYRAGVLRATPMFVRGVVIATLAIFAVYMVNMVLYLCGVHVSILHGPMPIWASIGISLVIVGIAALNLILDFDLIEKGSAAGFPRYMEWYAAFGLMVTLIWLYIEILRLLAKMRQK